MGTGDIMAGITAEVIIDTMSIRDIPNIMTGISSQNWYIGYHNYRNGNSSAFEARTYY